VETIFSPGPVQNDVYTKIAAPVIPRRYMGHVEVADILKEYLLSGLRSIHAQVFLDEAERQQFGITVSSLWRRAESLMLIGRAVKRIGEAEKEQKERDELKDGSCLKWCLRLIWKRQDRRGLEVEGLR
jgi:hypothetical protein